MLKLKLIFVLILLLGLQAPSYAVENKNDISYARSDNDIETFLREFITRSVANLKFLLDFVISLLQGAMGSNDRLEPINEIKYKMFACHH